MPENFSVEDRTPGTSACALMGDWVSYTGNQVKVMSSGWVLAQADGCPRKMGNTGNRHAQTVDNGKDKRRRWPSANQGERCGTDPPLKAWEGTNADILISDFQPPELGGDTCLLRKPPSLRDFVTATLAN